MHFSIFFAALVALVAADSTVYVTITPSDCAIGGTCEADPDSVTTVDGTVVFTAQLLAPSSPSDPTATTSQSQSQSINALSVLSQAQSVNALTVLASALTTYPSYGLTLSSLSTAAPTPSSGTPAVPPPAYGSSTGETSLTTVPVIESTTAPFASTPAAGTTASEISPITTWDTTAVVPSPPASLSGSALSSYEASVSSSMANAATSAAPSETAAVGTGSTLATQPGPGSQTGVETGAQSTGRGQTGAQTTAAPPAATNAAMVYQPAAIGLVAAIGAILLV